MKNEINRALVAKKIFFVLMAVAAIALIGCEKSKDDPQIETQKTVDLDLSVNWAICNVGATKPEEYGDYFAWSETTPKKVYNWGTYKYCSNDLWTSIAKYTCPDDQKTGIWYDEDTFIGDNKTVLELEDVPLV